MYEEGLGEEEKKERKGRLNEIGDMLKGDGRCKDKELRLELRSMLGVYR